MFCYCRCFVTVLYCPYVPLTLLSWCFDGACHQSYGHCYCDCYGHCYVIVMVIVVVIVIVMLLLLLLCYDHLMITVMVIVMVTVTIVLYGHCCLFMVIVVYGHCCFLVTVMVIVMVIVTSVVCYLSTEHAAAAASLSPKRQSHFSTSDSVFQSKQREA